MFKEMTTLWEYFFISSLLTTTSSVVAKPLGFISRIVGGDPADPGDHPYFVQGYNCGGALIAPDIVLFAAHCGNDFLNEQLNIGGTQSWTTGDGTHARFCEVWIPDPQYGTGGLPGEREESNYDFALCKLDKPVEIDDTTVVLEINEEDSAPGDGDNILVMGFGRDESGGELQNNLQVVEVPCVSNDKCNEKDSYDGKVSEVMLCAGKAGKDSCQRDSGGPLVKRELRDGKYVDLHVGVVSWGIGCGKAEYPGVYARTSKRADWIKNTTCNELQSVAPFCNNPETPTNCEDGPELSITVTTDSYPRETSWALIEGWSVVQGRQYNVKNLEYETKVCLEYNKNYEWSIYDNGGNGLCSDLGCGSYVLKLDGNEIASNNSGEFGSFATHRFNKGPPAPPTPIPTPLPTPPTPIPTPLPTPLPECKDDKEFAYKDKDKWDCKGYIKKKKAEKRCNKKWDNKFLYEWCPKTCFDRAGIGTCP